MGTDARLHHVVQAVEVCVRVGDRVVQAVITREALERHFGATATPQTWIAAHLANAAAIDAGRVPQGEGLEAFRARRAGRVRLRQVT